MNALWLTKAIARGEISPEDGCNRIQEEIEAAVEQGKAMGRAEAIAEIIEQQVAEVAYEQKAKGEANQTR